MGNRRRILALPLLLVLLAATTAVPAQRLGPPALPAAALQRPLPPALERRPATARAPRPGRAAPRPQHINNEEGGRGQYAYTPKNKLAKSKINLKNMSGYQEQ